MISWSSIALAIILATCSIAQQVPLLFKPCSAGEAATPESQINFTSFYGQLQTGIGSTSFTNQLNIVGVGDVGSVSPSFSDQTGFLATIIQTTRFLSYDVFSNSSALCDSLVDTSGQSCPAGVYGAGDVALGVQIPWTSDYPLSSVHTRIRILDTSNPSLQLACVDLQSTPFYPNLWPYLLFLWFPVALAISYGIVTWLGRTLAAYHVTLLNREAQLASSLTAKLSSTSFRDRGVVFWEAASGATLQASASLRRFASPSVRELIWAIQSMAILALVAVDWPEMLYPISAKASWSLLLGRIPITQKQNDLSNPLVSTPLSQLPQNFANQYTVSSSPIYLDQQVENSLLNLRGSSSGVASFAAALGIRPQDLFPTSAAIFLCLIAGACLLSAIIVAFDFCILLFAKSRESSRGTNLDKAETGNEFNDIQWRQATQDLCHNSKSSHISFANHFALLQGNCLRLLLLFHLPLVIFSTYQVSLVNSLASKTSVALAVLVLVFFGVVLPFAAIFRVYRTSQAQLQEHLPTMLAFGTLYSAFGDRSHCFLAVRLVFHLTFGVVLGAGQKSGTAQAITLLVAEIADTLITSLWLPWGSGAAMAPIAFVLSVARIVTAVLLVVLSPAVSVGEPVTGWLTYVILGIQAAVFLFFFFILLVKMLELLGRVVGKVPFDEAKRSKSCGLGGVVRGWDRNGKQRYGTRQRRSRNGGDSTFTPQSFYANQHSGSTNTESRMLSSNDRASLQHQRQYSSSTNADFYPKPSPADESFDDGYIMSAMSHGPWVNVDSGYVPPGSYAAPRAYEGQGDEVLSYQQQQPSSGSGFQVVRGGKATDESPYTMTSSLSGASGLRQGRRGHQSYDGQSSIDLFHSEASRPALFSNSSQNYNTAHNSEVPSAEKRGILGLFKRNRSSSDSSDEDDEEEKGNMDGRRRAVWPFRRRRRRSQEIEQEDIDPIEELITAPAQHSFQVIRKPRQSLPSDLLLSPRADGHA